MPLTLYGHQKVKVLWNQKRWTRKKWYPTISGCHWRFKVIAFSRIGGPRPFRNRQCSMLIGPKPCHPKEGSSNFKANLDQQPDKLRARAKQKTGRHWNMHRGSLSAAHQGKQILNFKRKCREIERKHIVTNQGGPVLGVPLREN